MASRAPDSLVRVIVGKLGSGKSWYAVTKMLEALACGEVVVTNLELNWPAVEQHLGRVKVSRSNYRFVSSADIDHNPDCLLEELTEGACLVVDEVHLFLNARMWRENQAKAQAFMKFLTQARKLSVDCYLISQDERNVDSQLVRMATHIVRLVNWRHLPVLGTIAPLPLTVARICQPDGVTAIGREWIWRVGMVGKCYESKQRFTDIQLTGRKAAPVRGKREKRMGYGLVMVSLGAGCLMVDAAMDWRAKKQAAEAAQAAAEAEAKKPKPKPKPGAVAPAGPETPAPLLPPPSKETDRRQIALAERARIEAQLPSLIKVNPVFLVLEGSKVLKHGSFFLVGAVKGWKAEKDSVVVTLDSPEIPSIRLFHVYRRPSHLYDYQGGLVRNTGRGGGGHLAAAHSLDYGVPQSGAGAGGMTAAAGAPAVYQTGGSYQPPAPYIPQGGGPLVDWNGPRLDEPVTVPQLRPYVDRYGKQR